MALDIGIPACQSIPIDGCVAAFAAELQALIPDQKTGLTDGIRFAIEALRKEQARILAIRASAQNTITALNAKIVEQTNKLQKITAVIAKLDNFLGRFPCPELEPLRAILEIIRAFIAAGLALINLNPIQAILNGLDTNLLNIDCHIENLEAFVAAFE